MPEKIPGENGEKYLRMTEAELSLIIEQSVTKALILIGIDAHRPNVMQKDFQHLRDMRLTTEEVRKKGIFTLLTVFIAGVITLIILGIKAWIKVGLIK